MPDVILQRLKPTTKLHIDVDTLRRLCEQDPPLSWEQIGRALGCSDSAARLRARKEGIVKANKPTPGGGAKAVATRMKRARERQQGREARRSGLFHARRRCADCGGLLPSTIEALTEGIVHRCQRAEPHARGLLFERHDLSGRDRQRMMLEGATQTEAPDP